MATEPKPRAKQTARDMLVSLGVLLAIVAGTLFLARGCQFSPDGPTVDPSAQPTVDAHRELTAAARRITFDVRSPAVPTDWHANTVNTVHVGDANTGTPAVRAGWVTPGNTYLRLSQSTAPLEDLVVMEAGGGVTATPGGTVDVGGATWTKYPGKGTETSWVTSLGDVHVLITGTGTDAEFRTLATATQTAPPLPKRS
ncbi:DUF4245 domain-containing protein [Kibdelosporangium lantanae]